MLQWFYDLKTGVKLIASFLALAALLVVLAVVGYTNLSYINAGSVSMYGERTLPIQQLGAMKTDLWTMRGDVYLYLLMPGQAAAEEKAIANDTAAINTATESLDSVDMDAAEKADWATFQTEWPAYQKACADILAQAKAGHTQAALDLLRSGAPAPTARLAISAATDDLSKRMADQARLASQSNSQTFSRASRILLAAALLGVLIAVALGLFISRAITRPLQLVADVSRQVAGVDLAALATGMQALAGGDLTRTLTIQSQPVKVDRRDEIGEMAGTFNTIIARLGEIGSAFAGMTAGLRDVVGQVAGSATQVTSASEQLASAAEQSGMATTQVTATIGQVAQGSSSQAESATEVAAAMAAIGHKVEGIARGAERQSAAVDRAGRSVEHLGLALAEVARSAEVEAAAAGQVAESARGGAEVVKSTVEGMRAVHESTEVVAGRVQEMGQRSEEIGKIVSTIRDIADQTNLLALNAAIEAARAGEQGRGFAVVADEVRKLAEKSGSASREISELVRAVQKGTGDAVEATGRQAAEVSRRAEDARQAGEALDRILSATEDNNRAAVQAKAAAVRIQELAAEVAEALRVVRGATQENLAATVEMTDSISKAGSAVEGVAAAAEENSASAEEVSATAEELSAQVEEVAASSQELAAQAETLQRAVGYFNLGEGAGTEAAQPAQGAAPRGAARPAASPIQSFHRAGPAKDAAATGFRRS
jgi:methyl-accepting chemotaxis protein